MSTSGAGAGAGASAADRDEAEGTTGGAAVAALAPLEDDAGAGFPAVGLDAEEPKALNMDGTIVAMMCCRGVTTRKAMGLVA